MHNSIQVLENQYGLQITIRWFKWVALFLVFFCIAWNSFLFFWYSNDEMPLMFYIFPLAHVAAGVGLSYYTLSLFINYTSISVDHSQIVIRHRPLPWIGNKTIDATQVVKLFVREQTHYNKGSISQSYELKAKLSSGRSVVLLGSTVLEDPDDAQFLEDKIEAFLNINDERGT